MRDAIVVGAGPNGLAAAIELARNGRSVTLIEAEDSVGGGLRSAELTRPGVVHDVCATVTALAVASPFFRSVSLDVEWVEPPVPLAHPLDDARAVVLERSLRATARRLGRDGPAYWRLFHPYLTEVEALLPIVLRPIGPTRHPLLMAGFGLRALRSAHGLAFAHFREPAARALLAGIAGHSMLPLETPPSAGTALLLAILAHTTGWPIVRGGSQRLADALAKTLRGLGGEIRTGERVTAASALEEGRVALLDVSPRQLLAIGGDALPPGYRGALERFRYGPGVFKLDYALAAPVPWRARECERAGTVHLGGTFEEIAAGERAVAQGEHPERPLVIAVQPTLFDPSRAPDRMHTLWAYCHVPNGSTTDMTERIEAQFERFAPGFRDRVVARHAMTARDVEAHDASFVGGDINGGFGDLRQVFARPVLRDPYRVRGRPWFLASSATPPGGGVHGMCGYHAARAALRALR